MVSPDDFIIRRQCTPFCEPRCNNAGLHHPILVAVINCTSIRGYHEFTKTISKFMRKGWSKDDPIPDVESDFCYPLVHWATVLGNILVLKWCVDNEVNLAKRCGHRSETALHRVMLCGYPALQETADAIKIFKKLVKILKDLLPLSDDNKDLPIHVAVKVLVERPVLNDSRFHRTYTEMLKILIEKTCKLNKESLNCQNRDGNTIMHILAQNDKGCEILEILLRNEADFDLTNSEGLTPLEIAKHKYAMDVIKLLDKQGESVQSLVKQPQSSDTEDTGDIDTVYIVSDDEMNDNDDKDDLYIINLLQRIKSEADEEKDPDWNLDSDLDATTSTDTLYTLDEDSYDIDDGTFASTNEERSTLRQASNKSLFGDDICNLSKGSDEQPINTEHVSNLKRKSSDNTEHISKKLQSNIQSVSCSRMSTPTLNMNYLENVKCNDEITCPDEQQSNDQSMIPQAGLVDEHGQSNSLERKRKLADNDTVSAPQAKKSKIPAAQNRPTAVSAKLLIPKLNMPAFNSLKSKSGKLMKKILSEQESTTSTGKTGSSIGATGLTTRTTDSTAGKTGLTTETTGFTGARLRLKRLQPISSDNDEEDDTIASKVAVSAMSDEETKIETKVKRTLDPRAKEPLTSVTNFTETTELQSSVTSPQDLSTEEPTDNISQSSSRPQTPNNSQLTSAERKSNELRELLDLLQPVAGKTEKQIDTSTSRATSAPVPFEQQRSKKRLEDLVNNLYERQLAAGNKDAGNGPQETSNESKKNDQASARNACSSSSRKENESFDKQVSAKENSSSGQKSNGSQQSTSDLQGQKSAGSCTPATSNYPATGQGSNVSETSGQISQTSLSNSNSDNDNRDNVCGAISAVFADSASDNRVTTTDQPTAPSITIKVEKPSSDTSTIPCASISTGKTYEPLSSTVDKFCEDVNGASISTNVASEQTASSNYGNLSSVIDQICEEVYGVSPGPQRQRTVERQEEGSVEQDTGTQEQVVVIDSGRQQRLQHIELARQHHAYNSLPRQRQSQPLQHYVTVQGQAQGSLPIPGLNTAYRQLQIAQLYVPQQQHAVQQRFIQNQHVIPRPAVQRTLPLQVPVQRTMTVQVPRAPAQPLLTISQQAQIHARQGLTRASSLANCYPAIVNQIATNTANKQLHPQSVGTSTQGVSRPMMMRLQNPIGTITTQSVSRPMMMRPQIPIGTITTQSVSRPMMMRPQNPVGTINNALNKRNMTLNEYVATITRQSQLAGQSAVLPPRPTSTLNPSNVASSVQTPTVHAMNEVVHDVTMQFLHAHLMRNMSANGRQIRPNRRSGSPTPEQQPRQQTSLTFPRGPDTTTAMANKINKCPTDRSRDSSPGMPVSVVNTELTSVQSSVTNSQSHTGVSDTSQELKNNEVIVSDTGNSLAVPSTSNQMISSVENQSERQAKASPSNTNNTEESEDEGLGMNGFPEGDNIKDIFTDQTGVKDMLDTFLKLVSKEELIQLFEKAKNDRKDMIEKWTAEYEAVSRCERQKFVEYERLEAKMKREQEKARQLHENILNLKRQATACREEKREAVNKKKMYQDKIAEENEKIPTIDECINHVRMKE